MNAQDVASFLQDNPEFFAQHPDLLTQISVPHLTGGQAISLTERQVATLRDKLAQVQGKLAELVGFGEENDSISEKVHKLTLDLLLAESFESSSQAIYTHLIENFAVPHVQLRLWNCMSDSPAPELAEISEELRARIADMQHPFCGPVRRRRCTRMVWRCGRSAAVVVADPALPQWQGLRHAGTGQ